MTSEQDCTSIRQQAIIMFCHDFGSIAGTHIGYAEIFDLIASKVASFDNINLPDMLHKLRSGEQHWASKFNSMTDYFTSNSTDCETELSDIIEQINNAYQDDFKAWYIHLKQLEIHYLETNELDIELTNLLIQHANNLTNFREKLRDELIEL